MANRLNDIAPSHITSSITGSSGIDLSLECSCVKTPMTTGQPCPCRCHDDFASRVARHRRFHIISAGWCPACQAIEAGSAPTPLA